MLVIAKLLLLFVARRRRWMLLLLEFKWRFQTFSAVEAHRKRIAFCRIHFYNLKWSQLIFYAYTVYDCNFTTFRLRDAIMYYVMTAGLPRAQPSTSFSLSLLSPVFCSSLFLAQQTMKSTSFYRFEIVIEMSVSEYKYQNCNTQTHTPTCLKPILASIRDF